jgi:hypothetical protein
MFNTALLTHEDPETARVPGDSNASSASAFAGGQQARRMDDLPEVRPPYVLY